MSLGRREYLAGVVGQSLLFGAGCSGTNENIEDIILYNESGEPLRGTLEVERESNGETIFEDEFEVESEPGSSVSFGEPIEKAETYEVLVRIDSIDSERFSWDVPKRADSDSQHELYGLQILVREQSISFKQISK